MRPDIEDTAVGRALAERHAAWTARFPSEAAQAWGFVLGLSPDERLALLAHCAALTVNLVQTPLDRRPGALAHGETLARAAVLDMTSYWAPTAKAYLGQVTKARILEAVSEGVSADAAERIADLKKVPMAQAAEGLLAGTGWLPPLLRTARLAETAVQMAAE
jgi:ParB family chromosome partitioning protein